jgi:hypothetical protein
MPQINLDAARADFEDFVANCIKPEAKPEFLAVGSPHWLDFKAGFYSGFVAAMNYNREGNPHREINDALDA